MDVTWGVTGCFVPTRGTDMEIEHTKKHGDTDNTLTTRYGHGQEQEDRKNEGEPSNPFAKAPRIIRTPPKGQRPRVDSCPEIKFPLCKIRGLEEKRKRTEMDPLSPTTPKETTAERESRTEDDVFVAEGSPSPESARIQKRKRELGPLSTNIAGVQIGETEEESAMTNGLIQLMQKLENMAGDMSYQTKKNVNTKVEIKKLAREIDTICQIMARKLHKYCKTVSRKLRKSSDKETSPVTVSIQKENACTKDASSQTEPSLRKSRRGEDAEKRIIEAATDEDIIVAANQKWQEEWYKVTTVRTGNPWNSPGEEDLAILLSASEAAMETGIARLLRDRFPEVGKIEGTGCLRVTNTVQIGTEEPVTKNRVIYKGRLLGTTDAEMLAALKELHVLVRGSRVVAIPIPNGADEGKVRKLADLVFRKGNTKIVLHIPQRKGGKDKTQSSQVLSKRVVSKARRDKDTEVLLVKQPGKTYGDMVKGLRAMVGPKQDVKALKMIRETQDGRLLLAFGKGEPEVAQIKDKIKATWEGAEVSGGGRGDNGKTVIHIKGLDVAVEDDEIWEAVHEVAPTLHKEDLEIGARRPMFGGNTAVTIRVANRDAEQLTKFNKIKIGFNTCTMEERVEVMKCFRCWEFGHLARQCKGPDRRSLCSGCGQEGHLVAGCNNAPYCLLCDAKGHRGGSGSCPRFREALAAGKKDSEGKTRNSCPKTGPMSAPCNKCLGWAPSTGDLLQTEREEDEAAP